MLTARASQREILTALELGATDHIAKPFSLAVLMQRVRAGARALITELGPRRRDRRARRADRASGCCCSSSTAPCGARRADRASGGSARRARRAADAPRAAARPTRPRGAALRAIPRERALALLEELAPSLAGPELRRAQRRSRASAALIADAERECASRRWRRRLHAVRVLSLLGGGERPCRRCSTTRAPEVRAQAAEWAAGHPRRRRAQARDDARRPGARSCASRRWTR